MRGHFPVTLPTTPPLPPWPNLTFSQSRGGGKACVSTWTTPMTRLRAWGCPEWRHAWGGNIWTMACTGGKESQGAHIGGWEVGGEGKEQPDVASRTVPSFKCPLNPTHFSRAFLFLFKKILT